MFGTFDESSIYKKQKERKKMIVQEIKCRRKKSDKIQSSPKPYDIADRMISYVQDYFRVGQLLSNPINISFSEPQLIFHKQKKSVPDGYHYYAYILKDAYKYQISITIDHDPRKSDMPTKWDISYGFRRYKRKRSLFDKLLGAKSDYSLYIKGGYLKTIDTSSLTEDELIAELGLSSIYLLEDLIKNFIDGIFSGDLGQKIPGTPDGKTAQPKIFDKLVSAGLTPVF